MLSRESCEPDNIPLEFSVCGRHGTVKGKDFPLVRIQTLLRLQLSEGKCKYLEFLKKRKSRLFKFF